MNIFRLFSSLQIGLMGALLLLVAVFFYEIFVPPPAIHISQVSSPSKATITPVNLGVDVFAMPSVQDFAEIDARPPFSPLRRPIQEPPPQGAAQPPPPPVNVALVGIIMGPNERIAMIRTSSSPITINARVEQILDGWKLIRIEMDHIVLISGSTEQEVRLRPTAGRVGGGTLP